MRREELAKNCPYSLIPINLTANHPSDAKGQKPQRHRGKAHHQARSNRGLKTRPHSQEVSQAIAVRRPDPEAWRMAFTSTSLNGLLDESLEEPSIGETTHFHWHATPVGIAALWQGDNAPATPPFDEALTEGLEVGLDLSREEREFHQVTKGLVLLFHS